MEEATITSKGQITIPKEIREALELKEGEKVLFILEGKKATIIPKTKDPLQSLKDLRKKIVFSRKEIEEMIKESKREWSKFQ